MIPLWSWQNFKKRKNEEKNKNLLKLQECGDGRLATHIYCFSFILYTFT
jgi:hypothetical protein